MLLKIFNGGKINNDDVMYYWLVIVGGVFGIMVIIVVFGVFIYVWKLKYVFFFKFLFF